MLSTRNAGIRVKHAEGGTLQHVQPKRKAVAIVGFEEMQYRHSPLNDPEYEVWGFNHANRLNFMQDDQQAFRADRWFDLHEEHAQSEQDMDWINTCPVPIYLPTVFGSNPNAIRYPIEMIQSWLADCGWQEDYFASSFAYAFVLAMKEGFTTIGVYGCSLDFGRELAVERGNMEYWIGVAQGAGYVVHLPVECRLLTHPALYGFEYTEEREAVELRMAKLVLELLRDKRIETQVLNLCAEREAAREAAEVVVQFPETPQT